MPKSEGSADEAPTGLSNSADTGLVVGFSSLSLGDSRTTGRKAVKMGIAAAWDDYWGTGALEDWQHLCEDLGLDGNLGSKTKCRKALKSVWVNIRQFLGAARKPEDVVFFKNAQQLRSYTANHNAFFPRKKIPQGSPLRCLLADMKL